MVRSSFERDARLLQAPQCVTQFCPRRIHDGQVIKPRCSAARRLAAVTLPSVQSDVMMVPAGREKCRRRPETLCQLKPKHVAIKSKGALQVRHFQMHVTHPDVGMNCFRGHAVMSRYKRCLGKCTANTMAIGIIGPVIASNVGHWSRVTCHAVVSTKEELTALNCSALPMTPWNVTRTQPAVARSISNAGPAKRSTNTSFTLNRSTSTAAQTNENRARKPRPLCCYLPTACRTS
jgi:hypothetical protein